jgi:cytosine/uracil/thiamine/allantoin permease
LFFADVFFSGFPHPHEHDTQTPLQAETQSWRGFHAFLLLKIIFLFFGCKRLTRMLLSRPLLGQNASSHPKMGWPLKSPAF